MSRHGMPVDALLVRVRRSDAEASVQRYGVQEPRQCAVVVGDAIGVVLIGGAAFAIEAAAP